MIKKLFLAFTLFYSLHCKTQSCYSISPITPSPDSYTGGQAIIFTSDDQWSQVLPIGFNFCFMGAQTNTLIVGTNSIISFDTSIAGIGCQWPINVFIPSFLNPRNSIMFPWHDLYIDSTITRIHIAYYGTSPNRWVTISYDSLPMYGCLNLYFTGQVKLFETSNKIEMHLKHKDICPGWNGGNAIMGLHNSVWNRAEVIPGRNWPSQWTANNEAWEFVPTCNVCAGVDIAENYSEAFVELFPNPATESITINYIDIAQPYSVEIRTISGSLVYADQSSMDKTHTINISDLSAGVYIVSIIGQNKIIGNKKLVVTRE
jgi:hypothetical protein